MPFGKGARGEGLGVLFHMPCGEAGIAQVLVQGGDVAAARHLWPHHIARAFHWVGGHGQPAGQGLQQDKAEGVGAAGKDKDIAAGIGAYQCFAGQVAEEFRVRVFLHQRGFRRAVADNHLGAGQIEGEEGLDVLFDRDAADIDPDGPRIGVARIGKRTEALDIDAA